MLQQPQLEKDIQRSLDRLQHFLAQNGSNLPDLIPSLYYSIQSDLLKKYSQNCKPDQVNFAYFRQFKLELQSFATKDLSGMKQHQKDILDQMLDIVNSDSFTQCLQPEIKSSRMKSETEATKKKSKAPTKYPMFRDSHQLDEGDQNHQKIINTVKKQSSSTQQDKKVDKQKQILFDRLLIAYREHRIDEAYALMNQYLSNKYTLSAEQKDLFSTIQLQYNTMISFYKQFDLEGWVFDKQENGVTLQYKIFEQQKQIAIRIASQFNASVENFLAILTEIDLMGTYIPFTYDSKELKVISRNQKIGTSKIYIPCLTDRQTYFYAAGYDRMKTNGSIFLFSKTINEDQLYQEKYGFKVPEKSDYIRLEYKFFIVEYIPLTKNRAKVRLASKVDMKLNFLPQFILNMSARKFAFDYFKNIIKMNKNFKGSAWQKKIKENPEFYGFFKAKVEEYMGKN